MFTSTNHFKKAVVFVLFAFVSSLSFQSLSSLSAGRQGTPLPSTSNIFNLRSSILRLASPVLAAGDAHIYVLIEVTTPLDTSQKILVRDALLELGRRYDVFPSNKTHLRTSLDNQSAIVEVVVPTSVTKAQVVTKLAEHLPWSEATIDANLNLTAFGGLGATWEESRQAAVTYLIANSADWEETP